ncbi:lonely Cys domain-containing protein, partial [Streptomyces sp. NPDC000941]
MREISLTQRIVNATRHWARVSYGPQGKGRKNGKYMRSLTADARGRPREFALERPEPEGAELDRLARVARLHSGPGAVPDAVLVRTLDALRALKSMFGIYAEDRADFGELLAGAAAVDSMWRADDDFERAGPLTLDLLGRVIAERAGPGVGVDQDVVRRVLAEAATAWAAGEPFGDFVVLPVVREAAGWLNGDGARAEAVDALKLSGAGQVREAERSRMFWARVKAGEVLDAPGMDETRRDALAVRVLHLDPDFDVDPRERERLRVVLTRAFAVGRDASDPDAAAAYDVEEHGAFDDTAMDTALDGAEGSGRDFTGESWSGVNLARIRQPAGLEDTPWRHQRPPQGRNQRATVPVPDLVRIELDERNPDIITLFIGSRVFRMPVGEFVELMANDPTLTDKRPGSTVVLSHARPAPGIGEVARRLTQLGRSVWWTETPTDLSGTDDQGAPVLTVLGASRAEWQKAEVEFPTPPVPPAPLPAPRPYPLPNSRPPGPGAPTMTPATTAVPTLSLAAPVVADAEGTVALQGGPATVPDLAPLEVAEGSGVEGAGSRALPEAPSGPLTSVPGGSGSPVFIVPVDPQSAEPPALHASRMPVSPAPLASETAEIPIVLASETAEIPIALASETAEIPMMLALEAAAASQSPDEVAAERLLEALRGRDRRFRRGPFDVDVLARHVLRLPKGALVDEAVRAELFGLVRDAEADGRAGSLAELGAFHLERLGVTGSAKSGHFTLWGRRVPGVNWLGLDALELDTDWSEVLTPQSDGSLAPTGRRMRETPWPKGKWPYVVGADWREDKKKVVVRLPDGSTRDVDIEEFVELVAADVARVGLPPGTPIVVAVPFLGRHSVLLQRLADRTGLVVWPHSGEAKVTPRGDGTGGIDTVAGRPGVPTGDWFPLRPGQGPVLDGSEPDWYPDVVMLPTVSEASGERIGDASFDPAEYAEDFEKPGRHSDQMTTYFDYHFVLGDLGPELELPRPGPEGSPFPEADAYRITLHGVPGYMVLTVWSGSGVVERFIDEGEAVAWVTWLMSRLPKDRWLDISCCWIGSPKD